MSTSGESAARTHGESERPSTPRAERLRQSHEGRARALLKPIQLSLIRTQQSANAGLSHQAGGKSGYVTGVGPGTGLRMQLTLN